MNLADNSGVLRGMGDPANTSFGAPDSVLSRYDASDWLSMVSKNAPNTRPASGALDGARTVTAVVALVSAR